MMEIRNGLKRIEATPHGTTVQCTLHEGEAPHVRYDDGEA